MMVTALMGIVIVLLGLVGWLRWKWVEARHHGDIAWGMVTDQDKTITRLRNERDEGKREAERFRSDRDVLSIEVGNLASRLQKAVDERDARGDRLNTIRRVLES